MLENKKIGRLSLGKSPRRNQSTTALQSSDGAKVQQNIDICKENLKNLKFFLDFRNLVYICSRNITFKVFIV